MWARLRRRRTGGFEASGGRAQGQRRRRQPSLTDRHTDRQDQRVEAQGGWQLPACFACRGVASFQGSVGRKLESTMRCTQCSPFIVIITVEQRYWTSPVYSNRPPLPPH